MTSLFKGLFGGESDAENVLQRFRPTGFRSEGLVGRFRDNRFVLSRTPEARSAVRNMQRGFRGRGRALRSRSRALLGQRDTLTGLRGELAGLRPGFAGLRGDIRALREDVRPGIGRITRSRVQALRGLGESAVGSLREELARRRVAGSSFAEQEIGSLRAQFAREEDRVRAESFLQEMEATNDLILQELGVLGAEGDVIGQETAIALQEAGLTDLSFQSLQQAFESSIASAQATLQQLNVESGLAAQLSTVASTLINENLTAQAEAQAAQDAGALNFLGDVIGGIATVVAASDIRLKKNLRWITWYEDFDIYDWEWNDEGLRVAANDPEVGLIAQQVLKVCPDAVDVFNGYLAIIRPRLH